MNNCKILKLQVNGIKLIWITLNYILKKLKKIKKMQYHIIREVIYIKIIIKYKKH
jgi:hypothetical protein